MLSPCRVGAAYFACEDSARCSRIRSLVGLSHARVSRGVSAIEAALAFELGPAHPSSLAASPENEIRDAFDPFLLPYNSVNEHPYPIRFRPIVTGSSPGVYSMGCRPPRPEIVRFTDAPIALADRAPVRRGGLLSPVRIFPDPRFSSSGFPGPRRRAIVPLTPLSRPSRMPVRAFFRGARVPTPPRPPRLLLLRPRERAKLSPAQDAFHRQGARCSSSTLSSGDCAPSSLRGFDSAFSRARPCGPVRAGPRGAIAPRDPVIDPSSPSAPLATRSFAARGFDRSARR